MKRQQGCGVWLTCRWIAILLVMSGSGNLTVRALADEAASADAKAGNRTNILLLVSDDQRPDTVAALGNKHIRTPVLDRLVREGTAFTRAVCANPICTPSRAEIFTGCSGFRSGVLDFGKPIDPRLATFAGTLQQAGYHTWYVGKWHNDGSPTERGYEASRALYRGGGGKWMPEDAKDFAGRPVTGYRGWVLQNDRGKLFPEQGVGLTADISARFADAAVELIEQDSAKPFFLHVNFSAPHDPLLLPPGFENAYQPGEMPLPTNFLARHPFDHGNFNGRDEQLFAWPRTQAEVQAELAAYYAVISHLDAQVGRILMALERSGKAENTIVIYTSDHGLAVGSHGLRGKQNMYEHTINVPMIWRGPGIPAGRKTDAQVYLREIFPTCCELAQVKIPETVEGKSFARVLAGKQKQHHEYIYGYFRNFQRMVRGDGWKMIEYPAIGRQQLFDLKNDPAELHDLAADSRRQEKLAELTERLRTWQKAVGDPVLLSNGTR